jgi:DNA replicative helicase MCM subunit Mcm2 (Cdc46/Mcm family)
MEEFRMTTESSWLDEIFGTFSDDGQVDSLKEDSKSVPQNETPKLKVLFELHISDENRNDNLKSIKINPQYQIVTNIRNHGNFKTFIKYEKVDGRFKIDWQKTTESVTNDLKQAIRTKEIDSITNSALSILDAEKDKIEYYINAIPTNGPLDSIREFIVNPDDSDVSDINDVTKSKTINVSSAIKQSEGYHKVKGAIISLSEPFKLIQSYQAECICGLYAKTEHFEVPRYREPRLNQNACNKCQSSLNIHFEYMNAIMIELQDDEKFSEIERLNCMLLDTDFTNVKVGEKVTIGGSIHITQKNQKGNLLPILFCRNNLDYQDKIEVVTSSLDEKAIMRFSKMYGESTITKLVDMFDNYVIGQDLAKKCLLLSLVSSGDDLNKTKTNRAGRKRIHTLLVGKPGLAKSSLLKKAAKLLPNSRFESSQHSSGKSLTAIVEKDNEHYLLGLGAVPLAKYSVCALNEIGTLAFEEQKYLLDAMEEGEFSINKHGIHSDIESPTTIIASTNLLKPTNDIELANGNISLDQIPLTAPVKDRFDLIAVVAEERSDDAILNYIDKKMESLSKPLPVYDLFLQKYIEYARNIEPHVDPTCNNLIKYYYAALKKSNPDFGSNRMLETIIRLCKAISKLKLKQIVDELDVNEAISLYDKLISKYISSSSRVPIEPDKYAFERCLKILEGAFNQKDSVFKFEDLLYKVCENDAIVRRYILDTTSLSIDRRKLKITDNHKARQVRDLLVESPLVRIVGRRPLTLQISWANRNL